MTNDLSAFEIQAIALKMGDYLALLKFKFDLLESRVSLLEEKLKEKIEVQAIEDSTLQELIKNVVDEDYVKDIIDDYYIQYIIDSDYITTIVRDNISISID